MRDFWSAETWGVDGIRLFILHDHALVRRGLQDLMESEGFVVGMSRTRLNAIHH